MTQMAVISEEIHDTETAVVPVSRFGEDGVSEIVGTLPMALVFSYASFMMGLPLEFVAGIGGSMVIGHSAISSYCSMQKMGGNYIEMISPQRSLLTRKEQMRAWAFLPGKEISRTLETFYIKDSGDAFGQRLKSGLFTGLNRVDEKEATHKVTHEIKSSWRGAKIIQTIEPLENYLWDNALEDTSLLFELTIPEVKDAVKASRGTTMAERIKAIEFQTSQSSVN